MAQLHFTHLPADYPDQGLVSDIRYGVRFRAKLPLQLVLVPHLVDVNKNFDSLQAELRRLAKLSWYDLYTGIPFVPGRFHAQGLVDRKYEPGRPRRKTDAGCPRNEIFDSGGVRCPSLNEAIAESDQHLELLADDPDSVMLVDIEQHTPPPAVNWPYECKPRLSHVEHDLAILNHLAFLTDDFVYGISDEMSLEELPINLPVRQVIGHGHHGRGASRSKKGTAIPNDAACLRSKIVLADDKHSVELPYTPLGHLQQIREKACQPLLYAV